VTLLVNYWKEKTAGEEFTHQLPQEELFLDQGKQISKNNNQFLNSLLESSLVTNNTLRSDDRSWSHFPSAHTPTHIYMSRDFKDDLLDWQQQILPSSYGLSINQLLESMNTSFPDRSVIPTQCISIAIPSSALSTNTEKQLHQFQQKVCSLFQQHQSQGQGVYVFHLPISSMNQRIKETYSSYTMHNWMSWKVSEMIGEEGDGRNKLEVVPSATTALIDETIKWKEGMPGDWKPPIVEDDHISPEEFP
jgi:hypothetical protein